MRTSLALAQRPSRGGLDSLLLPAGTPHAALAKDAVLSRSFTQVLHTAAPRTVLLGLGKLDGGPADLQALRLAAARAGKTALEMRLEEIRFDTAALPPHLEPRAVGRALAEGLAIAALSMKTHPGAASPGNQRPVALRAALPKACHAGFKEGLAVGAGITTARALAHTPPNVATPGWMEREARALAKRHGLGFKTVDAKAARRLGMGGLLAVGGGSVHPPRLLVLEWKPAGTARQAPILLVGKTVTFDTGGYSLKPDGGKGMKADKSGGCTMLGVMEALARLGVKRRVVCILAVAENMVDALAYRLDDVVTHCNGVTCEITNTDAEGRLVLAEALAWGTRTYRPAAVIDAATLTGGVVVALGKTVAGAFTNDDDLLAEAQTAAAAAGERLWRLPLDEGFRDMMRATVADLHNSAPVRHAHPIQGAAYLSFFVGEDAPKAMPRTPWLHLDIAGPATCENEKDWEGLYPKGATGWGVRTLVNLLENHR